MQVRALESTKAGSLPEVLLATDRDQNHQALGHSTEMPSRRVRLGKGIDRAGEESSTQKSGAQKGSGQKGSGQKTGRQENCQKGRLSQAQHTNKKRPGLLLGLFCP